MCTNSLRWELQSPWTFSRSVLLIFMVCWWTVQPFISSMLFKALSRLCLTVLSFFPLFHAMSTPALHLIASTQKQTVPVCRACKTHCCTSWVKVFLQTFTTEISEMSVSGSEGRLQHSLDLQAVLNLDHWSPFWMVESAQHPDSCNVSHDCGRCIYETLQPSQSPRHSWCLCFTGVATIPWPFRNMAMITQGIQGHS